MPGIGGFWPEVAHTGFRQPIRRSWVRDLPGALGLGGRLGGVKTLRERRSFGSCGNPSLSPSGRTMRRPSERSLRWRIVPLALTRTWMRRRHDPAHLGLWWQEAAETPDARGGRRGPPVRRNPEVRSAYARRMEQWRSWVTFT